MSLYARVLLEANPAPADLPKHGDLQIVQKAVVRRNQPMPKWGGDQHRLASFTGPTAMKDAEAYVRKAGYKKAKDGKELVWKLKATALKKQVAAANKAKKKAEAEKNRQIELWGGKQKLDQLLYALSSFTKSQGWQTDPSKFRMMNYGGKTSSTVEGSFRDSELPKEGAYEMGEYDYYALVDSVIKQTEKQFKQRVAGYVPNGASVSFSDGEKSWIYIHISPPKQKPRGFGKPKYGKGGF